jgi:hypothetical protein
MGGIFIDYLKQNKNYEPRNNNNLGDLYGDRNDRTIYFKK